LPRSSPPLSIRTARLRLVAGNEALSLAELEDRSRLAALLEAEVSPEWPPPLNDEASIRFSLEMHRTHPETGGWANWYFLLEPAEGDRVAVGNGGFRGEPSSTGCVEIGYSILESHQRQGIAKEAVDALVAWAFANDHVQVVQAQTLPELRPSIRVLEKCGFHFVGPGSDEGAILYEHPRLRIDGRL
jgi:RimJ/RimL family protein N-acetyltransferase